MSWNNRNRRKSAGNRNKKELCSTGHFFKGKVFYWNNRPMCKRCYAYHCQNVRVMRPPKPPEKKGFFQKLFGW